MTLPWNYRPDYHVDDSELEAPQPLEWEDNAGSNMIAWISEKLTPNWCQTEAHWTSRLFNYWYAECGCCLFFRGVALGAVLGLSLGFTIGQF